MKYFWLTTMLVILEIYISLISIKQFLLNQCHSPYNRGVQVIQGAISTILWFIWYMYYFSACSRGLLKSYYCYVLFSSRTIASRKIAPWTISPQNNCLRGKLPPHHKISPENTFPFCRYLRVAPGENTYLPKKTGFPCKNC